MTTIIPSVAIRSAGPGSGICTVNEKLSNAPLCDTCMPGLNGDGPPRLALALTWYWPGGSEPVKSNARGGGSKFLCRKTSPVVDEVSCRRLYWPNDAWTLYELGPSITNR